LAGESLASQAVSGELEGPAVRRKGLSSSLDRFRRRSYDSSMQWHKHFDIPSILTIALTLILFITAIFLKGFTHDLLLESGVFLVSVKLILMSYKNGAAAGKLDERLARIETLLGELRGKAG
jgi:hypothetical protein